MKVVYDWLKEYVGADIPPGERIEELFTFHAFEVEERVRVGEHEVIDVKVLPDRSSDCLSHRGIAHELVALMGTTLAHDPLREPAPLSPTTDAISVTIHDTNACRRFGAALMHGVKVGPSPDWLRARLEALGQRSINNVVDATNYVMLALGQPLHAYDADKFTSDNGVWRYGVRMAKAGEEVTTLTDDTYTLTDSVQLIVNEHDGAIAGIAGVKGGKYAEVDVHTTSIILEAANFDPSVTRIASQTLRLQTDASKRFENNISPELVPFALRDVVALIREIAGGTCEGFVDVYPTPAAPTPVFVTHAAMESLLGTTIPYETATNILNRLSFRVTLRDGGWEVVAPFERTDITIPEDVIAEIGRVHGYDHVAAVVPEHVPLQEINVRHYYSERIRTLLTEAGYSEVITSSFRNKDVIRLANALASDKGCLRSALRKNIVEALDRNAPFKDLLGIPHTALFEIGTVFNVLPGGEKGIEEHVSLAIGVRMKQQGYTPKDDAALGAIATMLETALGVPLHAHIEGGVLECDLSSLIARLPVPEVYEPFPGASHVTYKPFSTYPFVSRDIALWAGEEVAASDVETMIRACAGDLLVRVTLFDTFAKDGRVSYGFRLIFQSYERTLTDAEVGDIMHTITGALVGAGYEVR